MSTGKVITLASMVALFLVPASFAAAPGSTGENLNYVGDGYLPVDYNMPVDYNTAAEFQR